MLAERVSKAALLEYTLMLFLMSSDTKYANVPRLLSGEQSTVFLSLTCCLSG